MHKLANTQPVQPPPSESVAKGAPQPATDQDQNDQRITSQMRRMTRRSFAVGGTGALFGLGAFTWISTRAKEDGTPWPLRRMLEFNEKLAGGLFSDSHHAPEFDLSRAGEPKVNGMIGIGDELEVPAWRLSATSAGRGQALKVRLDDVQRLPKVEMVNELKCVEGWSKVVHWTGARLADFADYYRLATRDGSARDEKSGTKNLFQYVSLETPDRQYFVGLDIASALHPQTLLCYEMNGRPLTEKHGAPLRLVIPVKYGIKNIKRIGSITFTDQRPKDYWAKRGYDWYAGL